MLAGFSEQIIPKELNYTKGQAESLWLQGISIAKSNPEKSIILFKNALHLAKEIGNMQGVAKLQIAKIYFAKNDLSNALKYAQSSLEIAENLKLIKTEKDLHELLSNIYAKNNNYHNAYIHSKFFKQLNDSIFNENNIRQLTELEFTYKFEKEKQTIAIEQQKEFAVMVAKKKQQLIIIIILAISVILVSLLALLQWEMLLFLLFLKFRES